MTAVAPATSTKPVTGRPSRALTYLPATTLIADGLVTFAAAALAIAGRERLPFFEYSGSVGETLGPVGPLIVLGWLVVIAVLGGYRRDVFGAGTDEYRRVATATLFTAGLVGVGCFLANFPLSRGFFALLFLIGLPSLLVVRYALRKSLHGARRHGLLQNRVLVSGTPDHVDEIARVLARESWLGYDVVGAVTPVGAQIGDLLGTGLGETGGGVAVLGPAEDVLSVAVEHEADIIFFAGGSLGSGREMRQKVWELESHSIGVVVAPSVTDISSERMAVRPVGGLPLIHIDPPTWTDAARWGKRLFDLVGATALLLAATPLFAVSAVWIKLHDRGPVLFRQTRIGRHGDEFSCLKFRTMVIDAEERLASLHAQMGYTEGLFKMMDDPRITRPGKWLRRFSIDELPQLLNVLRGEMSLVGPRPPLPREVERYDGPAARRLHVRPGMTGLWQVSGRSNLAWDEAIRLDLYYVDNWSMIQDVVILARTIGAVLGSRGAY